MMASVAGRLRALAWAHALLGVWIVVTVLAFRLTPGVTLLRAEAWPEDRQWILALSAIQIVWGLGLAAVGVGLWRRWVSVRPWAICLSAVSVYHFLAHGGPVAAVRWWRVLGHGPTLPLLVNTLTFVAAFALGAFSLWFFTRRAVRQALPVSTRPTRWLIPVAACLLLVGWEWCRTGLQEAHLAAFERSRLQQTPGSPP